MNEFIINDSICQSTSENIGEIKVEKPKAENWVVFTQFIKTFILERGVMINAPPALQAQ